MKIAILTLPLRMNYGGLLQAFALQTVLVRRGHEVWVVDRPNKKQFSLSFMRKLSRIKRLVHNLFTNHPVVTRIWMTEKEEAFISQNTKRFIQENIRTIRIKKLEKECEEYNFDAFIVGSDQVWRPCYANWLTSYKDYFLEFTANKECIRLAYAASFGTNQWEYSPKELQYSSQWVKHFDSVSVREKSAVDLCSMHWHIEARQVLDPTLLLEKEDYMKLAAHEEVSGDKFLLVYVLDQSLEKELLINKMAEELQLKVRYYTPKMKFEEKQSKSDLSDCVFQPVSEWIAGFRDASFVFTDSFHGTVFSIIFSKQFLSIQNEERGADRFISLLEIFGLQDRLINPQNYQGMRKLKSIDFSVVNTIWENEKVNSLNFIQQSKL